MTSPTIDPGRDLLIQRTIRAPRVDIWRAWTRPDLLARWWTPAPTLTRVDLLDARPGGGFVTRMSEDGQRFVPHTDAVFLLAEPEARLVFSNAVTSEWRPANPQPIGMTAEIVLDPHPDGTDYRAIVRHGDPEQRSRHEELGFFDGWSSVTAALAALAEGGEAS